MYSIIGKYLFMFTIMSLHTKLSEIINSNYKNVVYNF